MPKLTVDEQRKLGAALAAILQPLPNDQRLLFLMACFYGEARSQGLVSGEMVAYCERLCAIHEQHTPIHLVRSLVNCPLCGQRKAVGS